MRLELQTKTVHLTMHLWARTTYAALERRLARYQAEQEALAREFGVEESEPRPYDATTRSRIVALAEASAEPHAFAWTSGTTSEPKQLFYPHHRSRLLQRLITEQVILTYDHLKLSRPAFYLLTSMKPDRSFSSHFARKRLPAFFSDFILGDSVVHVPSVAALTAEYSQEALHLALLLLSQPALIVGANPSSLYVLLESVRLEWDRVQGELGEILERDWVRTFRRRGGADLDIRLQEAKALLQRPEPPGVPQLLPRLQAVLSWDSGYLRPFLENLQAQLSEIQPTFYPMFSLSTETVAYLNYPRISTTGGLPIYPGVCYEFLRHDAEVTAHNLLKPWELERDGEYMMVVSDAYGLKRYQTDDLFVCLGFEGKTPILHFLRRAGLLYSFTGEKVTAQQLQLVYDRLSEAQQLEGVVFTCFPQVNHGTIPNYVFVACPAGDTPCLDHLTSSDFDRALMEVNEEYATKRNSGRLAPPDLVIQSYLDLESAILGANPRYQQASRAQFKLLPLYQLCWEDLNLPVTRGENDERKF